MNARARAVDYLAKHVHPAGGWGYAPGSAPQVEPTCLALLALASERQNHAALIERGLLRVREWQRPDGSFRIDRGHDGAIWPTALALFTLTELNDPATNAQEQAAAWLLAYQPGAIEDPEAFKQNLDIDPEIRGWSWALQTFSWAEPTAWAVLALTRAGLSNHPRVQEGRRLLIDRIFDTGGMNCGNKRVFDRLMDPVPASSALGLLAFGGDETHDRLRATRTYLEGLAATDEDLENLCWFRLALSVREAASDLRTLDDRIAAAYQSRRESQLFPDSTLREALTALALGSGQYHPFRPRKRPPAPEVPERAPSTAERRGLGQRFQSMFRGMAVKALGHLRAAPPEAHVHIAGVADYEGDLAGVLCDQYEHFRAKAPLKDKRVVLKPNLVEYHPGKVINTHPNVIAAAIELCRREGAREVLVADGPGHWRNVEYLVTASGLGDVLRHYKTPFIDLNHDTPVQLPNLGRLTKLEYLYLAETITSADVVISLAKLKTHHWAGVTLSLKNLFGVLPGICYGWPKNVLHWRGIENSIVDIALTRTPDLAIVDGIIGMEGDGPLNGTPVHTGVLVMGVDPVAVDATCCRIMELNPAKVGHLALSEFKRLGLLREDKIIQLGQSIAQVRQPFEVLPHYRGLYASDRRDAAQPVAC